ncbi:hypothetical protein J4471_05350 [Candidatus Woesearchaeota archaeon]|nr:hypothetical protein [Candidatus Woesearchaeota archaeon]
MLGDKEIGSMALETHYEFSIDYLIECKFEIIVFEKFVKLLEKSGVMQKLIAMKFVSNPKDLSLVVYTIDGDPNRMYICKTILNRISKKFSKQKEKLFLKAIVLHELCHALSNSYERNLDEYGYLLSTEDGLQNLREEYPDSLKILEEGKKFFLKVKKSKRKN